MSRVPILYHRKEGVTCQFWRNDEGTVRRDAIPLPRPTNSRRTLELRARDQGLSLSRSSHDFPVMAFSGHEQGIVGQAGGLTSFAQVQSDPGFSQSG